MYFMYVYILCMCRYHVLSKVPITIFIYTANSQYFTHLSRFLLDKLNLVQDSMRRELLLITVLNELRRGSDPEI